MRNRIKCVLILLYLGVLPAIAQASPPIPRQTPNSSAKTGAQIQQKSESKKNPADPVSTVTSKEQTATADGNRDNQAKENANNPIRISELPPVTINSHRDWADWGVWVFTGLLAITSLLQVWLLCRTLTFARRQTHEIKRQRSYMRLQWKAMRDQIDSENRQFLMTHRPWVSVTGNIQNELLSIDEKGLVSVSISYRVKNGGTAPAIGTIVMSSTLAVGQMPTPVEASQVIGCSKIPEFMMNTTMGILILPGDSYEVTNQLLQTRIVGDFNQPQEVWFTQCIRYMDELGELHGTGLLWRFDTDDGNRTVRVVKSTKAQGKFTRIGMGNESY